MTTFYYTPTACSTGCHIALEESGAKYQSKLIKLHRSEEQEKYRLINPRGTVPALQIDGHLLLEGTAILWFVAQRFPEAGLWPENPLDQAESLSMMGWFASSVHIARRQYRAPHYFTSDITAYDALRAGGHETFLKHLVRIENLFSEQEWLINDCFSVVDCYALVFYHWGVIDNIDMSQFPAFTAFKDRMLLRPATQRVLARERCILAAA